MGKNLTRNIFIGLFAGIFVGLFLGEYAAPLGFLGDAFIGLMQMTVMPYIIVSLIANLGKMELTKQRKLLTGASFLLVGLLLIGIVSLAVLPFFFPQWQSSTFFSTSFITPPPPIDFIEIYIPSNLFFSLTENIVPAVVIFCIFLGISLNSIPKRESLIHAFEVLAAALNKANKYIIRLTPFGLFGIAANTVATLSLSELSLLQVYVVIYTIAVVVLGFLLLPLLVSAVTPFGYKDILGIPKNSLITIFATGKIIILLPQLIENVQQLFGKYGHGDEETQESAELLLPLAYPFPNLGTLVIMIFVPFAAWFAGKELGFQDQLTFLGSVLMSSFVAPVTGIPFLLDTLKIPADLFQLFIVSTALTDRVRVVLGAIHLLALAIMAIAYSKGLFKVNYPKLIKALGVSIAAALVTLIPYKSLIGDSFQDAFDKYTSFVQMDLTHDRVPEKFGSDVEPFIPLGIAPIQERGIVRVGYSRDMLPYVYRNQDGELVGYDVELMEIFAAELELTIEWIEVPRDKVVAFITGGLVDVYVSGIPVLADRMTLVDYTVPYAEINLALLVKDHDRKRFRTIEHLRDATDARFATNQTGYLRRRIEEEVPGISFVQVESARDFLVEEVEADAMFFSAEAGSAWTLVYPDYSVVKPDGLDIRLPVSMVLAKNSGDLEEYLNEWIRLKEYDGTLNSLHRHWILGEGSVQKTKQWSILRDVLGWVE